MDNFVLSQGDKSSGVDEEIEYPDVDLTSAGPSTAQPTPAESISSKSPLADPSRSMEKQVGDPLQQLLCSQEANCGLIIV